MPGKIPSTMQRLTNWWSQRTLAQRFATLTAVLIASSAIIQGAVLIGVSSSIVSHLEGERVEQRLDKAAGQLAERVKEFRTIPLIMSGTPPIERIAALSTGSMPRTGESLQVWLQRLGIIFRSIVQAKPSLIQARFIGAADGGRELVRVDRIGDALTIVEAANLQRKGDRPYFKDTAKLRAGDVYLSSVDANVENGLVVVPYQPMVRAATPVFTASGAFFGIIVVNAAADAWLRDISALSGVSGDFVAANQNGDYVFRSDGGPIFGSLEGGGAQFERDLPQLNTILQRDGPRALKLHDDGAFVSARRVAYDPADPSKFLVLATDTDASTVFGDTWTLIVLGVAVALAMAALGVLAAYFVSRPLKGLMSAAKQIAEGKLDVSALAKKGSNVEIGEVGQALRIMEEAVESRDASLQESEAQLQAIIENTIDGLITFDRHGTILRYNHGCEHIFGYSCDKAIGQNIGLVLAAPDARRFNALLDEYAETGHAQFVGGLREKTAHHESGHLVDIEMATAEIMIGDDVVFSTVIRDVTERKKAERMKSEFISSVTHELRTPLTSIMGSLGLLQGGVLGPLSEDSERMIKLAHDNGARLVRLINDILDIDKIKADVIEFKRQNANLKHLLEQAAEENAGYAEPHHAKILVKDVPSDIVIETDPDRFQQVMGNLISNAAKFSPKGGEITITAEMTGETVRVSVSDKGPGIEENFRERVFERFAQADSSDTREKGGTGLGLSISKAIIERLGGTIGFDTKVGSGTTFYFDLPAHRATPDRGGAPTDTPDATTERVLRAAPRPTARAGLPRALHVEDDTDTCAVLAGILSDVAGVTAVPTAGEARTLLAREDFDLVILDLLLPDEDGESVLCYLSERDALPPRVLVYSVKDVSTKAWPMVASVLVKSRTDIPTLRARILELLHDEPSSSALQRSA